MRSAINVSYISNGRVTDQRSYAYDSEAENQKFSEVRNLASEGYNTSAVGSSEGLAYVDDAFIYRSCDKINGYEGYTLGVQDFKGLERLRAVEYIRCKPNWVTTGISQETLEEELPYPEHWLKPSLYSYSFGNPNTEQRKTIAMIVDKLLSIKLDKGSSKSIQLKSSSSIDSARNMLVKVLKCLPVSLANKVSFKVGSIGQVGGINIFCSSENEPNSGNAIDVVDIDSKKFKEIVKEYVCKYSYSEYLLETIECSPESFNGCSTFEELNDTASSVLLTEDLENVLKSFNSEGLKRIKKHCERDVWENNTHNTTKLGEVAYRLFFTSDYVRSDNSIRNYFEPFLEYAPDKDYTLADLASVLSSINGIKGQADYLQVLAKFLDNDIISKNYKTPIRQAVYFIDREGFDGKIIKSAVVRFLNNLPENLVDNYLNAYYEANGKLSKYIVNFLEAKYKTIEARTDFLPRLNNQTREALLEWENGRFIYSAVTDVTSFKTLADKSISKEDIDRLLMDYLCDEGFFSDRDNKFKTGLNCGELKTVAKSLNISDESYVKIEEQCNKITKDREYASEPINKLTGMVARRQTNLFTNFPMEGRAEKKSKVSRWEDVCEKERNIKDRVKNNAYGSYGRIFWGSFVEVLIFIVIDLLLFFVPWIEAMMPLHFVVKVVGIIKYIVLGYTLLLWIVVFSVNMYRLRKQKVTSKDLAKEARSTILRLWLALTLLVLIVLLITFIV